MFGEEISHLQQENKTALNHVQEFFEIQECSFHHFQISFPFWSFLRFHCHCYCHTLQHQPGNQGKTVTCITHSQQYHAEKTFIIIPLATRIRQFSYTDKFSIQHCYTMWYIPKFYKLPCFFLPIFGCVRSLNIHLKHPKFPQTSIMW